MSDRPNNWFPESETPNYGFERTYVECDNCEGTGECPDCDFGGDGDCGTCCGENVCDDCRGRGEIEV